MTENNSFFTNSDLNLFLNQNMGGSHGWSLNPDYDMLGPDNNECEDGFFNIVGHQSMNDQDCYSVQNNQGMFMESSTMHEKTMPNTSNHMNQNFFYYSGYPAANFNSAPHQYQNQMNHHATAFNNANYYNNAPSVQKVYQTPYNSSNTYLNNYPGSHGVKPQVFDPNYPAQNPYGNQVMEGDENMEDGIFVNGGHGVVIRAESEEDLFDPKQSRTPRNEAYAQNMNRLTQNRFHGKKESMSAPESTSTWSSKQPVSIPTDEAGSVRLSSKMDKYNLFMIDGLLYIRRDKCLAFEVKVPFPMPDFQPTIEYRLKVKQRDATHYANVYKENFVEYEFNGASVMSEVETIPEGHIDRERGILRIPFKLTKGQKDLVEGYKNIFKLQFTIKWGENLGCSIWFSFKYDSRGNEKKSNYKSVTHICGQDFAWISPMEKDVPVETVGMNQDTPIIYMEPRIVVD